MMGLTLHNTALGIGAVFLLVGVLGFIPGITTNYGAMTFAGHESGAMLLGVFQVSILHNIVHLLFGAAGIAMARTNPMARWFLLGGGVVYLLLWIYGLVIDRNAAANFIPFNLHGSWKTDDGGRPRAGNLLPGRSPSPPSASAAPGAAPTRPRSTGS